MIEVNVPKLIKSEEALSNSDYIAIVARPTVQNDSHPHDIYHGAREGGNFTTYHLIRDF